MYVLKTRTYQCAVLGYTVVSHIYEMTAKELREAVAEDSADAEGYGVRHRRITPEEARNYIRNRDVPHSTGLWHDGERWRYAKADPTGC